MSKFIFFLPLLTAAIVLLPSNSSAQQNRFHQHRLWNSLGLDADQKAKLLTMHNEMRDIRKKNIEAETAVRVKIKDELSKSNPSKNVLSGYVDELGKLHDHMIQSHIDHLLQIKTILTPDQFHKVIDKQWNGCGYGEGKGRHGACGVNDTGSCLSKHGCKKNAPACHNYSHVE